MPNCFQLTRKGSDEATKLQEIDNELWLEFNGSIPEPNDKWYMNWYNTVGLMLACGKTFEQIKEELSEDIGPVVDFLNHNYTARSWAER